MPTNDEVRSALETIFDADTGIYRERGFQRRVSFGRGPPSCTSTSATWTRPGHAFSCDGMDTIIPAVRARRGRGRAKGFRSSPTTAYGDVEGPARIWACGSYKIPVELSRWTDGRSDERIAPEQVSP